MMIVPMVCGSVITTLFPKAGDFFGSFTRALFTGTLPILAVFYVCMGATIDVRSLPRIAQRGGLLMGTKILLGVCAAVLFGHLIGVHPIRTGWFAGLSTLAVVAAINDTNGGLYMALMGKYGSAEEAAAYSVMALESGPFFTMVTLGVAGLSSFPWQTLLGAILPLCVGVILGNLDHEIRELLRGSVPALIPFFAFALGANLDLHRLWEAGLLGIMLGVAVVMLSSPALILVDRSFGGKGTAGIAAASTAGNAAVVPLLGGCRESCLRRSCRPCNSTGGVQCSGNCFVDSSAYRMVVQLCKPKSSTPGAGARGAETPRALFSAYAEDSDYRG